MTHGSLPTRGERLPGTVKSLSAVSLMNDLASEMVYPLLPAFVTQVLGGGALALGALDGAADLASGAVRWISGRWADLPRFRKSFIRIGYSAAIVLRPLIAVTTAAWHVIGLRVLDRIGKGLRSPARDALIAQVTPPRLHGRAFGFHRGADHLGAVLGALAAWALLSGGSTVRGVILWSAVPGVAALIALQVALRQAEPVALNASNGTDRVGGRDAGSSDAAGLAFWGPAVMLVALVVGRLPETLLLLRLQDLGTPVAAIPLVWGALHLVRSAAAYPGGALNDRVGPRPMVVLGGVLLAATLALFAGARTVQQGVMVFLGFGLVSGLMEAAEKAMVVRLAPVRTGRAFGAFQGAVALSALPVALLYGAVYQREGASPALLLGALVVAVATVGWAGFSRRV